MHRGHPPLEKGFESQSRTQITKAEVKTIRNILPEIDKSSKINQYEHIRPIL